MPRFITAYPKDGPMSFKEFDTVVMKVRLSTAKIQNSPPQKKTRACSTAAGRLAPHGWFVCRARAHHLMPA
jgi:hypothetical protein